MAEILHIDDLKASAHNSVDTLNLKDGYTMFLRFTKDQRSLFKDDLLFNVMSLCSSGVYLALCTRGTKLSFRCKPMSVLKTFTKANKSDFKNLKNDLMKQYQERSIMPSSYYFTLQINGEKCLYKKCKKGKITFYFSNKEHKKVVLCLFFPVFSYAAVKNFRSNHSISIAPINKKQIFCLGDSITQGFSAINYTDTYVAKLAQRMEVDALNQGVGGYWFDYHTLVDLEKFGSPKIITVAYGTNDWQISDSLAIIKKNCSEYFKVLNEKFPNTPIFVITPIWRADIEQITKAGKFCDVSNLLEEIINSYPNLHLIRGIDIPIKSRRYFGDNYLHPNKEGFTIMAAYICQSIRTVLEVN